MDMETVYGIGIALCMVALLVMLVRHWRQLPSSRDDDERDPFLDDRGR